MTTIKLTPATIAKLHLEPGDVIVITVTDPGRKLTKEIADRLVEQTKHVCGQDRQVMVLPYGLEIQKLELAVDDKAFGEDDELPDPSHVETRGGWT